MKFTAFLSVFTIILTACACSADLACFEYSQMAMGVRARIVVYASDQASAEDACRKAFDRIAYLEDVMSNYRPDSELMRLCAKAGGPPVQVSPELLDILRKAQRFSLWSDGAFDITVGPMIGLWRQSRKSGRLPSPSELAHARKLVGWRKVDIDPEARTVRLAVPGLQLDLGGIAKGYACDEAIRVLREQGIKSALVEMGGDIVVSDPPPGRDGWEIGIANASDPEHAQVTISNAAVSSSGDTEQFVEIGGKRYSHIVDPRTGLGLTNRIAVTVIGRHGYMSDGLSTTISVLGADKGRALAGKLPGVFSYIRTAEDGIGNG